MINIKKTPRAETILPAMLPRRRDRRCSFPHFSTAELFGHVAESGYAIHGLMRFVVWRAAIRPLVLVRFAVQKPSSQREATKIGSGSFDSLIWFNLA
ncbi:MAG: hypothetical protein ABSH48_09800 [Verrucomicrobiota bacterium]